MSNQPMMEVELYAFNSASGQFLLTPHEFDVDLDGNLYTSLSIERNELALGAEAQNLGALIVNKHLNGKLTAITAMPSFDLFITSEQRQTVTVPSLPELLPLRYMKK